MLALDTASSGVCDAVAVDSRLTIHSVYDIHALSSGCVVGIDALVTVTNCSRTTNYRTNPCLNYSPNHLQSFIFVDRL